VNDGEGGEREPEREREREGGPSWEVATHLRRPATKGKLHLRISERRAPVLLLLTVLGVDSPGQTWHRAATMLSQTAMHSPHPPPCHHQQYIIRVSFVTPAISGMSCIPQHEMRKISVHLLVLATHRRCRSVHVFRLPIGLETIFPPKCSLRVTNTKCRHQLYYVSAVAYSKHTRAGCVY
jgi:hypothetical protein